MKKTLIFNLYGTIIDSYINEEQELTWVILSNYFEQCGIVYTPGELNMMFRNFKNKSIEQRKSMDCLDPAYKIETIFKKLFEVKEKEYTEENIQALCDILREHSTKYIKLHEDVASTIKYLRHKGYKIYGYYNGQKVLALHDLRKLNAMRFFDGLYFASEALIYKTDTKFYHGMLKAFNTSSEEATIISNEIDDIKQANKLNIDSLFILTKQSGTVANNDIPENAIFDGNFKTIKKLLK